MKLQVNGEEYHTDSATLLDLLEELKIAPGRVAVEINLKVIRRADMASCALRDGDALEIVNFVGGGSQLTVAEALRLAPQTNRKVNSGEARRMP
jgi:thiamine biosynthesis protein ThiS